MQRSMVEISFIVHKAEGMPLTLLIITLRGQAREEPIGKTSQFK